MVDSVKPGFLEHQRLFFGQESDGTAKMCSLFFHDADAVCQLADLIVRKSHTAQTDAMAGKVMVVDKFIVIVEFLVIDPFVSLDIRLGTAGLGAVGAVLGTVAAAGIR